MSANNTVGVQGVSIEYVDHLHFGILKNGPGMEQIIDYYNKLAQEGTYETMMSLGHYSGATMAAEFVDRYFGDRKDDTYIIDVAAGTGFVGDELKMRGFTKMDALDASYDMLSIAKAKNIYGRIIHDCMDGHRTDIKDDTYDAMTISGSMGEGLIPTRAMTELIRIVKPGGYLCIITREEFLTDVPDYVDRLEPFMKQLAEQGAWTREERKVVPSHIYGTKGIVFVFRVEQSGAPSVTSTQFTKSRVCDKRVRHITEVYLCPPRPIPTYFDRPAPPRPAPPRPAPPRPAPPRPAPPRPAPPRPAPPRPAPPLHFDTFGRATSLVEWNPDKVAPHVQEAYALITTCTKRQFADKVRDIMLSDLQDMAGRVPAKYARHCVALRGQRLRLLTDYAALASACPGVVETLLIQAKRACETTIITGLYSTETLYLVPDNLRKLSSLASYKRLVVEPFLFGQTLQALGLKEEHANAIVG
ncbi:hypothetical protein LSAT2_028283 [Lamellibrachia satsuma]|nr:hypothetical protein LSAT2_028283 [Lamellibrachia satsuma]